MGQGNLHNESSERGGEVSNTPGRADRNYYLDLNNLRKRLELMEDLIIIELFERSLSPLCKRLYEPRSDLVHLYYSGSLLDRFLFKIESSLSELGKFECPEEHPFSRGLHPAVEKRPVHPFPVDTKGINFNRQIKEAYPSLLRKLCVDEDDPFNHGSILETDIRVLQTISRRVHYGIFVAESKYEKDKKAFKAAVSSGDEAMIRKLLVVPDKEKEILARVRKKAQDYCVNPAVILGLYQAQLIPWTTIVEIDYIKRRVNG